MCVFKYHAFIFYMRPPRWRYGTLFALGKNWNEKGTFLFIPRKKFERRNLYICSRMKIEQKGTFLFASGKSGTKRNKSFCLNWFLYRLGTYPFAPGRKRNKKERLFLLQEKIETKKNVYLYSGKSGTKRSVSFCSRNVERIETNTKVFI